MEHWKQEKLLLPFLSLCLQCGWLKAAKQTKFIASHAKTSTAMCRCPGRTDFGCAVLATWPLPVQDGSGHSWAQPLLALGPTPALTTGLLLVLVLAVWLLLALGWPSVE